MIDLTRKTLPNTVTVNGRAYSIHTDFRMWLRFLEDAKTMRGGQLIDVSYLFKNDMPSRCDVASLMEFASPHNEVPRGSGSDEIILDYKIDSDFIVAGFWEHYQIDLTSIEYLHWHVFLALMRGLTIQLRDIMQYRSYKKDDRKDVDVYEELKRTWEIIPPLMEEEQEELDEFSKTFGG